MTVTARPTRVNHRPQNSKLGVDHRVYWIYYPQTTKLLFGLLLMCLCLVLFYGPLVQTTEKYRPHTRPRHKGHTVGTPVATLVATAHKSQLVGTHGTATALCTPHQGTYYSLTEFMFCLNPVGCKEHSTQHSTHW